VETTHPLSSQSPASRRAFSLLELLITIAIIALLAALLLPAISRAKESGRRVACLNNVPGLELAIPSEGIAGIPIEVGDVLTIYVP